MKRNETVELGTIPNQFYMPGISYGRDSGIETEFLYKPSSSEIQAMLNKYVALRIMLMMEGNHPVLVGMPAAAGDYGGLAKYFMQQGMEPIYGTLYHIVNTVPKPFLTLDGCYDKEEAPDYIYNEYKENAVLSNDLDNAYTLISMLPTSVDASAVLEAIARYKGLQEKENTMLAI